MVRESLAPDLPAAVPALLLTGSARTTAKDGTETRLGRVTVLGMATFRLSAGMVDQPNGATVSARVAERLGVTVGDEIVLGVQKMSAVPRSSLLGKRSLDDVTDTIKVTVRSVLPPEEQLNDFNLTPNPEPPLNVMVPLALLQKRLDLPGKVQRAALLRRDGRRGERRPRSRRWTWPTTASG